MGLFRPCGLAALALLAQMAFGPATAAPGRQTLANPQSTAFENEEHIAFAVAAVDACEVIFPFTNTIATPPTHGTATAGQAPLPYGDQCPGQLFPHAVAKYKWTGGDAASQDSFVTNVQYPTDVRPVTVDIKRGFIEVKSVDVASGKAIVDLNAASDTSGTVTFEFVDANGVKSSQTTKDVYTPATGKGITIDRPKIKKGKYTKVNVIWNITTRRLDGTAPTRKLQATYTPAKPWNVLGVIRYSQYNVPIESECVGAQVDKWVVDSLSSCKFTATKFKSDFLNQTKINGTGSSTTYGYIKPGWNTDLETRCAGKFPNGATKDNSYLQMSSVIGSCNMALVPNVSVATKPKNCASDQTLVNTTTNVNLPVTKNSDDTCPGCGKDFDGTDGHIDNFTNIPKCKPSDIVDLGNYWTLRRP
jgi:hypothetical protein